MRAQRLAAALAVSLVVAAVLTGGARSIPAAAQPVRTTPPANDPRTALVPGWNFVAWLGPATPIPAFLATAGPSVRAVWAFDARAQRWLGFNVRAPHASDLTLVGERSAIWVHADQPTVLPAWQAAPTGPQVLVGGLNSIAYDGPETPISLALAAAGSRVRGVWRWDAARQRWQGAIPGAPQASEFSLFQPGRAYSVQLAEGPAVALGGAVGGAGLVAAANPTAGRATPPPAAGPPAAVSQPAPPRPAVASPSPIASAATAEAARSTTVHPRTAAGCLASQVRQPMLHELRPAFNRAGFGQLVTDPEFALPPVEAGPGDGRPGRPGYVPPTLLKAVAWAESRWRQADWEVERGARGRVLASSGCAYGVMQILTGMQFRDQPTLRQERIATDFIFNIAEGARFLIQKWNYAPESHPVVRPRDPTVLEDWYFAVWAYHCWGDECDDDGLHNHPDDPVHPWPRPVYNSPEQLANQRQFTRADYPYQELVFGLIQHPPRPEGGPLWTGLPVTLPPAGSIPFPAPRSIDRPGVTLDPTRATDP